MAKEYDFYLGKLLLPVTPSKFQMKIKNFNKTVVLINEGEINLLKKAGLTDISFTAEFPNVKYPYAKYKNGFQNAAYYLEQLEKLKTDTDAKGKFKPFQFIISRTFPNGKSLFDNNIKVSLEDYKPVEDSNNALDVRVEISLKMYKDYGTKTVKIQPPPIQVKPEPPKATVTQPRPAETAPSKSIDDMAREVIRGNWGNNPDRKAKLTAAGHDYAAIQARVNQMLGYK